MKLNQQRESLVCHGVLRLRSARLSASAPLRMTAGRGGNPARGFDGHRPPLQRLREFGGHSGGQDCPRYASS
jgi:hypothetical protein